MSELIKHECGLALIRLKKPVSWFQQEKGNILWGLHKLYLMMEKQHNRGQDGAGMAAVKLQMPPGKPYLFRHRAVEPSPPLQTLIRELGDFSNQIHLEHPDIYKNPEKFKLLHPLAGEIFLGHLRYGTHSENTVQACHPVLRRSNWRSRTLLLAGNFNLTNADLLFENLVNIGQHPFQSTDTVAILERLGYFLDEEHKALYQKCKADMPAGEIYQSIEKELDWVSVLKTAAKEWDGGYVLGGIVGHGLSFALRDPHGIRPAFYYEDDEVVAVASERPALATAFNAPIEKIIELPPAHVLLINPDGSTRLECFTEPKERKACAFEKIYLSRGNDPDIYQERKQLGKNLIPAILPFVEGKLDQTVFSYVPNTAYVSFRGVLEGIEEWVHENHDGVSPYPKVRGDQIITKDAKLRTFISDDSSRNDLIAHVYDVSYGAVKANVDQVVVVDDSIVRGSTLKRSILRMLNRLNPTKIIFVSSAPQIRYPDCYGIDMSKIQDFIAFQAVIELIKERKMESIIHLTYEKILKARENGSLEEQNFVKDIYAPFTDDEISKKITQLVTTEDIKCPVHVIFQSCESMSQALPNNTGDWCFTGNYPTPGGNRVVNISFLNYVEGRKERAY